MSFTEICYMVIDPRENHCDDPSKEFELAANSLGAHMIVTESSPGMGHGELVLRTFI